MVLWKELICVLKLGRGVDPNTQTRKMYFSACSELKEGLLLVHRLKKEEVWSEFSGRQKRLIRVLGLGEMTDTGFQIGRKDWSRFSDWLGRKIDPSPQIKKKGWSDLSTEFLMYIGGLRNSPSSQTVRKDLSKFSDWEEGLIQVLWLGRRIDPGTQIQRKGWSELSSSCSQNRGEEQLRSSYQDKELLPVLRVVGRTTPSYQTNYSE